MYGGPGVPKQPTQRPTRGSGSGNQPHYVNRGGMWVKVPAPAVRPPPKPRPAPPTTVTPRSGPYSPRSPLAPPRLPAPPRPRLVSRPQPSSTPTGEHGGGGGRTNQAQVNAQIEADARAYARNQARLRLAHIAAMSPHPPMSERTPTPSRIVPGPSGVGTRMIGTGHVGSNYNRGAPISGGPGRNQVAEFSSLASQYTAATYSLGTESSLLWTLLRSAC